MAIYNCCSHEMLICLLPFKLSYSL